MTDPVPYRAPPLVLTDVRYAHGPDSWRHPDVPVGRTVELRWDRSSIYPGTSRRVWIHVPAQYDPREPAGLASID